MRVTLRPTVAADLAAFTGQPLPHRIQAITAEFDGRVLGVGGLGFRDGIAIAFAQITDEGRRYPAAIHRAGRAAMGLIRRSGLPRVVAEAEADNPAAARWLERLGFRHVRGRVYVWEREVAANVE